MTLKDTIKKGARKLLKRENLGNPSRSATPPPSFRLQIAGPANLPVATPITLSPPPLITRPASAPPVQEEFGTRIKEDTWPNLATLLGLLDQSISFIPLKAPLTQLKELLISSENAAVALKEYGVLQTQLEGLFNDLSGHFASGVTPVMTMSMLSLCRALQTELEHIRGIQDRNTISRYLQADQDLEEIAACYQRVQSHLERLMLNANLTIWAIVDKQTTESQLAKLAPSMSSSYNSAEAALVRRRQCTAKTREQVLRDLETWKNNPAGEKIFWMSGMAGTGKTTIATTFCSVLERDHNLGASFFCARMLPECRNIKFILPTLAYQLARFSIPFQGLLCQALERDPDVHTKALQVQFERMILEPLGGAKHSLPANLVVVIDALDECEDGSGVEQILDMLLEYAPKLPIKFLISSRPEPHIREKIDRSIRKAQLTLHELDELMVKEDIETYLKEELASISLSNTQLEALVERAGVLFIYAATVVRYLGAENFSLYRKRLDTVLKAPNPRLGPSNNTREIDSLYEAVLVSALNNPNLERSEREQMELVLHTVVCAQEPLTVDALAGLLRVAHVEVQAALRPFWSVLHISGSDTTHRVGILHASFPDYMLDSNRSSHFACNDQIHHGKLAELCIRRVEQNPTQFNLCQLDSSCVFDENVPGIIDKIHQAIPLDLLYACQYWAIHLDLAEKLPEQATIVHEFLSERMLLWMEVLNLKNQIVKAIELVEVTVSWLQELNCSKSIILLAQDARRFVMMFATSPVSRSTPHLYVSMLASWPGHQPIAEHYAQKTTSLVQFKGIKSTERQLSLLSLIPVTSFNRVD